MKYCNELTVQEILDFDAAPFVKDKKDAERDLKIYPNKRDQDKKDNAEEILIYLNDAKQLIKDYKLAPKSKVGISFIPELNPLKTDELFIPKIGGVPSCFFRDLQPLLKDEAKCYELLKIHYPKSPEGWYLRFVGDLDLFSPMRFLNELLPGFSYERYGKEYHLEYFYEKKHSYGRPAGSCGSIFVDENFGQANLKPNGQFHSLRFDMDRDADRYSEADQKAYIKILRKFIDTEVNDEKSFAIDNYKLQSLSGWTLDLETPNKDGEGGSITETRALFKAFGYPRSQQTVMHYYCVAGFCGPRLMNPFLTLFSKDNDNIVQLYGDLLGFNCEQESRTMYLKTDISST